MRETQQMGVFQQSADDNLRSPHLLYVHPTIQNRSAIDHGYEYTIALFGRLLMTQVDWMAE